ncbi:putative bifunctional diguanylate cyclase/phosphodiesterase [Parvibaculum lavamentivorans]|nr:EAL domain-containing protein [Parvibaculum lavamentivorans]
MAISSEGENKPDGLTSPVENVPMRRDPRAWARACATALQLRFKSHFVSVRAKVVSLLTLVGGVLIAVSGALTVYDFNEALRAQMEMRAVGAVDVLTLAARRAGSLEEMEPVLSAITGAVTIRDAAVAGEDGRVAVSSHSGWLGQGLRGAAVKEAAIGRAVPAGTLRYLPGYGKHGGDFIIGIELPRLGKSALAVVRVDADLLAERISAQAWTRMMWLTISVILAVLTVSMLIHRVVVAPIEALRRYAEAGGGAEADVAGPDDEIGIVARALSDSFQAKRDGEDRLERLAATDGLTELGNRSFFKSRLGDEISRAERHGGVVGVMILNLDNFKDINDTLGHDAGDQVLRRTADILKGCRRGEDVVARIGGDEFGVIVTDIKNADDVLQLASRLVRAVSAPFRLGTQELTQGACVGLTLYPQDGRDADVLVKNADLALSRAKHEGSGACVLYRHELHLRAIERNTIERDLRVAMARNELKLFYQPKIDMATGRVTGAEALIRWRHEERGFISPAQFIPVAERTGLIVPLTKWVLDEACRQNREWQELGLPKIGVAVNVSAVDLKRTDLTDTIASTLIRRGLSPQYLELEVTESMVMQDVDVVIGTLRRLRGLGLGIGIDDFGTGYSSLAYLKRFPVKRLKIDRTFVSDIADGRDGHVIPKVIIDLAHALGVMVVAEGVESADQYDMLRDLGCDEVQGYFAGRPMPAAEFEVFLRNSPAGRGIAQIEASAETADRTADDASRGSAA